MAGNDLVITLVSCLVFMALVGCLAAADINGMIAGAALDVRATEPPPEGDAIVNSKLVVLTPHIAAFTHEAQERVVESVCRDASAVLRGGAAEGYFNFPQPKPKR